jgi:hypothetical protein
MKRQLLVLLSAAWVLLTGSAYAATKAAGCCPPCPFGH